VPFLLFFEIANNMVVRDNNDGVNNKTNSKANRSPSESDTIPSYLLPKTSRTDELRTPVLSQVLVGSTDVLFRAELQKNSQFSTFSHGF
jgi:hypothetical protein